MSAPFNPQSSVTINSVTVVPVAYAGDGKIALCTGTSVPTDGSAGFAHGCLFIRTSGTTALDALYSNAGTAASSNFDPVILPPAQGAVLTASAATITQAGTDSGDVAIQAITSTTPFGFANAAEGEAIVARVRNLMTRVNEIEARLIALNLLAPS